MNGEKLLKLWLTDRACASVAMNLKCLPNYPFIRVVQNSLPLCRYGCKQEATILLQEWAQTVGRSAGLSPQNTRLSSGSVGVPESRLEVSTSSADTGCHWPLVLAAQPAALDIDWIQNGAVGDTAELTELHACHRAA